ncbi:hypothetical protein ABN584_21080 [Gloeocapsa sp. BRSZ]
MATCTILLLSKFSDIEQLRYSNLEVKSRASNSGKSICSTVAVLLAGPLADKIFEPTVQSQPLIVRYLGTIFGTSAGSGIAFLYVLCAVCMFLVGCVGYAVPILRELDTR